MKKVLIPMANGFEEIEAVTIIDILRRGRIEVITASIHSDIMVEGAHGMKVKADALFADVGEDEYDAIILPGGATGTENLSNCEALIKRLQTQREVGKLLCAICAAPTIFNDAGLLSEKHHVTCYPTCRSEVHCQWTDQAVVVHDGFITSQAPGTAMIFALVILSTLMNERTAREVARGLVFNF